MYLFQILMCCFILSGKCYLNIDIGRLNTKSYFASTHIPVLDNSPEENLTLKEPFTLRFTTEDKPLQIVVQAKKISILNKKTSFYYFENDVRQIDSLEELLYFVEGYVDPYKNSSYVSGYLKNKRFYGSIYLFNKVLFIEEIGNEVTNNKLNAIVHEYSNDQFEWAIAALVYSNDLIEQESNTKMDNDETFSAFRSIVGNGKVCTLFVLIDNSFLRLIHRNNAKSATTHILHTIEEVNSMFRSTDFDGDGIPDNIGFIVKHLSIISDEESPMNFLPKYQNTPIDAKDYLLMFSRYDLLNDVCLGVVFTGQSFKNGTIGVSFTAVQMDEKNFFQFPLGGICDQPLPGFPRRSLNTLAISYKLQKGMRLPQHIFELSLAHELGHSFGSGHDTSAECRGYLMTDHTPEDERSHHFLFSPCSRKIIVDTIINQGYCLQDDDTEYCGNGILEKGEECDCGTVRNCLNFDPCCIPRGQPGSCSLRRGEGFQCHPSQGLCCSSRCLYNDFSQYGMDCHDFQKSCPCKEDQSSCPCGVEGNCIGDRCSSNECIRLNTTECKCPFSENRTSCHTCCLHKGTCLDSEIITKSMLSSNTTFLEVMRFVENTSTTFGYIEKFCNDFKNSCVSFEFRAVKRGQFCLLFGEVGLCTANYQCEVPAATRRFPERNRRSFISRSNSQIPYVQYVTTSIVIITLLDFFMYY